MAITYTPTTNFGAKDSLPTNDPDKVIKGSEFTTEFTAIQTAFGLAAPVASPTFTGTVTIPTADINGGNIDGTVIGASSPAAATFTTGDFNTSLNVDGTVTADGLTVSGAQNSKVAYFDDNSETGYRQLQFTSSNNGQYWDINSQGTSGGLGGVLTLSTRSIDRLSINTGGDISFYEDTGTTAKFFWDASAESLDVANAVYSDFFAGVDDRNTYIGIDGTDVIRFTTNSAERARIDSSGNLLVGRTSTITFGSNTTTGAVINEDGRIDAATDGEAALIIQRLTSDGNIANFYKDGTQVGSIGNNTDFYIASQDGVGLRFTSNQVLPCSESGAIQNGSRDLGSSSGRFKDLYLAGDIEIKYAGQNTDPSGARYLTFNNTDTTLVADQPLGGLSWVNNDSSATAGETVYVKAYAATNAGLGELRFGTGAQNAATERMRIDSSGNVLVGTDAATFLSSGRKCFEVNGSTNSIFSLADESSGSKVSKFYIHNDQSNALITYLSESGIDQRWYTGGGERMRLINTGHFLVGKTTTSAATGAGHILLGSGSYYSTMAASINTTSTLNVYSTGAGAYRFYVGMGGQIYATSTSITALSDVSLKENVRDLDKGLDTILALKPRRFDWKNGDGNDIMGFVAQEVQETLPELIHEVKYDNETSKLGLKMGDMIPSLVKAIQEQQEIINDLRARVAQLEGA